MRLLSSNGGIRTHFCRRFPMKSCRPIRAKTLRQKTVRTMALASFFTDWMRAPTIVFRPKQAVNSTKMINETNVSLLDLLSGHQSCGRSLDNNHSPGMTVMVFRARRTRKVLKTETFPKSTNSVKYLQHKHDKQH